MTGRITPKLKEQPNKALETPFADGSFRIFGPHSPERVDFDTIINGQALRAR